MTFTHAAPSPLLPNLGLPSSEATNLGAPYLRACFSVAADAELHVASQLEARDELLPLRSEPPQLVLPGSC